MSEIRTWKAFAECIDVRDSLRPSEDEVIKFVTIFRNGQSASKYVQALRWVTTFERITPTWDTPALKQVLRGLNKMTAISEGTPALTWRQVISLKALAFKTGEYEIGTLFVLACVFMFRVPNELLPLCWDKFASHSKVVFEVDSQGKVLALEIHLKSRKNCPQGSILVRRCVCKENVVHPLCPVHTLATFFAKRGSGGIVLYGAGTSGGHLFNTSPAAFQLVLRRLANQLGIPRASSLTSKAFRRGSARELLRSNCTMAQVLVAGQWRSAAFLNYLARSEVDERAIFDCIDELSDNEGPSSSTHEAHTDRTIRQDQSPFDHLLAIEDGKAGSLPDVAPSTRNHGWERARVERRRPPTGDVAAPKARPRLIQSALPFRPLSE